MSNAYLCLGSNLADRAASIERAITELSTKCQIISRSSVYETEPVSYLPMNWFLNQVIEIETKMSAQELLDFCLEIETKLGRKREKISAEPGQIIPPIGRHIKQTLSREIDIDILLFNDQIINEPNLKVPHPRMHVRRFMLKPLCEIAPNIVHPILKKKMKFVLRDVPSGKEVRKV